MPNFFYNSTGSNTAPYDTWAKAATSLATVAAAMAAGDTLFVGDDSNESVAGTITATFPGTAASPNFIYCADHLVATPGTGDLKVGAAGAGSVTTTGANALTISGTLYCYGVAFVCGSTLSTSGATGNYQRYENCIFSLTGATGTITATNGGGVAELINCTFSFANAASGINPRGITIIKGGSCIGTAPTTLFTSAGAAQVRVEGFDYSLLGAAKTLVGNVTAGTFTLWFVNCKENAALGTRVAALTSNQLEANFVNCDSGTLNSTGYKYNYAGTQSTELTIVRSTGAAQPDSTGIANKIVATANAKFELPFRSFPLAIWNPTTGAPVVVTVHGVAGAAGLPNTDDIWLEVEYLGSGATPLGSIATNTKNNNLATGAAYIGDGETWAGSPAGTPFSMIVTLGTSKIVGTNGATTSPQPGLVGVILVTVCVGKGSATYYVDPLPVLS